MTGSKEAGRGRKGEESLEFTLDMPGGGETTTQQSKGWWEGEERWCCFLMKQTKLYQRNSARKHKKINTKQFFQNKSDDCVPFSLCASQKRDPRIFTDQFDGNKKEKKIPIFAERE